MGETIATNKKAFRDYTITEKWEGGVVLNGSEVKSLRAGHVDFKDSFARIDKGEVYLYNFHINPYNPASYLNEKPDRIRKLLLKKKEIRKIAGFIEQRGLHLVPLKIYFNNRGFAKVEIAIGTSKKLYDKREDIKKRDVDRDIGRRMRSKQKGR